CPGTTYRHAYEAHHKNYYEFLKQRYTNCNIVDGNLEINFLVKRQDGYQEDEEAGFDLGFLKDIKEVTGYVMIQYNEIFHLNLSSLLLIRGQQLCNCFVVSVSSFVNNCSLFIPVIIMAHLSFSNCPEISRGDVMIYNNGALRFVDTVNWVDVLSDGSSRVFMSRNNAICELGCHPSCECHPSCADLTGQPYCWGPGPEMCHRLTKVHCECDNRCEPNSTVRCCSKECAAGCSGSSRKCLACKNFYNDGVCEENCPVQHIYDSPQYKTLENPKHKYAYGSTCVKPCPNHLLMDKQACVKHCAANSMIVGDSCVECGSDGQKPCLVEGVAVNASSFIGCQVVDGNLMFDDFTWNGDVYLNLCHKLFLSHVSEEWKYLESVEEVTGFVRMHFRTSNYESLSFLKNLKTIRGVFLDELGHSLGIAATNFTSLGLDSLTAIKYGNVKISRNKKMCYVQSINWSAILKSPDDQRVIIGNNNNNCESEGKLCHPECSDDGCWGPGDHQCISCRNFKFQNKCVLSCQSIPLAYASSNTTCSLCHEQCLDTCDGPGAENCTTCRFVRDRDTCTTSCPKTKYTDKNNHCQNCHKNCGEYGCTGPLNNIGANACNSCDLVSFEKVGDSLNATSCMPITKMCATGLYRTILIDYPSNHSLHRKQGCKPCHPECLACWDYGTSTSYCHPCKHFKEEDKCVSSSIKRKNVEDYDERSCLPCHTSCLTCYGPDPHQCYTCKHYIVYHDYQNKELGFNCSENCPANLPHKLARDVNGMKITECVEDDYASKTGRILAIVLPICILTVIAIVAISLGVVAYKKSKAKTKIAMAAVNLLNGIEDMPLNPSGLRPNMSRLNIISESELRLGEKIGQGAFGSVFKGVWTPSKKNVRVYVAIKILHETWSNTDVRQPDYLSEVEIMCNVKNEYCVQILAVCLASKTMIVTQLMPYGCMLDFIRDNQNNLGSKVLLNWARQIASGMAYLEEVRIVHRDLAARNVLVQNDNHVRITDFGLSKLLDAGTNIYYSKGGKIPIKWLALESLRHKKFTHSSDVWSFGVTLWEMFTFGDSPYENVKSENMVEVLEKGDRLAQPTICTIDVYMVMIKCWLVDADSRPTFSSLVETFSHMAEDPTRFLFI
ncbi:hypothetical protein HELRODRAFT_119222, partial [Helobdella robusta]|uniref:receptor protein-tyrosine kinase n=1 Tax=Helobdella robusta TaxID=6412 RepID=T1EGM6_HELRO